ncbi:MAG TPA: type IV secretion system DNA-binding domain-containing protein, partial [Steroidobacteraceae bacterium]|nr:type IV secretion system DNA-binding domain-containing protein [Steroidobacteraceae bacterium]
MTGRVPQELLWLLAGGVVLLAALMALRPRRTDSHRRGARVLAGGAARRNVRRRCVRHRHALRLAGVPVAPAEETRHFKLIGATGAGKSTAIAGLVAGALARGDRVIITDPDGGYRQRFYQCRRGDVLLNPFEPLSVKWDPFAEIRAPWDVEQLASGLIPSTEDPAAREWRGYARTFVAAVTRRCCEYGWRDAGELWRLLTVANNAELRPLVAGSPAQPFLDPENARMFGSIRSVAASAAAALEYVRAQRARGFSVRDWVSAGRGVLFMPYAAAQIAALRTIIATWMRLSIFEAMGGAADERRLWFVIDELDSLGPIDGLKDALARLRKFGGRCVLGFQSLAQVSGTYGPSEAQTIIENCGNTLILRCSASEHGGTSQFASRLIGEREVVRRQTARGRDREGWLGGRGHRRSTQVSEQRITELAV